MNRGDDISKCPVMSRRKKPDSDPATDTKELRELANTKTTIVLAQDARFEDTFEDADMKSAAQGITSIQPSENLIFTCDEKSIHLHRQSRKLSELSIPDSCQSSVRLFLEYLGKPDWTYHPKFLKLENKATGNATIQFDNGDQSHECGGDRETMHTLFEALQNNQILFPEYERLLVDEKLGIYKSEPIASVPRTKWHDFMKAGQTYFYARCGIFIGAALDDEVSMGEFRANIQSSLDENYPKTQSFRGNLRRQNGRLAQKNQIRTLWREAIEDSSSLDEEKKDFAEKIDNTHLFKAFGRYDGRDGIIMPKGHDFDDNEKDGWRLSIQGTAIQEVTHATMLFILDRCPKITNKKLIKETKKCAKKMQWIFLGQSMSRGDTFDLKAHEMMIQTSEQTFDLNPEKRKMYERFLKEDDGPEGCPAKIHIKAVSALTDEYIEMLAKKRKGPTSDK